MCVSCGKIYSSSARSFKWSDPFPVLGIQIDHRGSCHADVDAAEKAAWARWFITRKCRLARSLPLHTQIRDLIRTVLPAITFRCSWWQYSSTLLSRIRSIQLRFISCLIRIPPRLGELPGDYSRRRALEAQRIGSRWGSWDVMCGGYAMRWFEHANRNHARSWPGYLLAFRSSDWLERRRLEVGSSSAFAGKLNARASRSRPRTRFEDGIRFLNDEEAAKQAAQGRAIPARTFTWLGEVEFRARSIAVAFASTFAVPTVP